MRPHPCRPEVVNQAQCGDRNVAVPRLLVLHPLTSSDIRVALNNGQPYRVVKRQMSIGDLRPTLCVLCSTLLFPAFEALSQSVSIPDPVLRDIVRVKLEKFTGAITEADMLSITELDASRSAHLEGTYIRDLTGLEYAGNLERLDLSGESGGSGQPNLLTVEDFSPLGSLSKLRHLDLGGNEIVELTFPGGLTNLETLLLDRNLFYEGLTFPAGMQSLRHLDISRCYTPTLPQFPSDWTALEFVDLSANAFPDTSFLPALRFAKEVRLSEIYNLTQVSIPEGFAQLETLIFRACNNVTNVTFAAEPPNLKTLDLSFTGVADFQSLGVLSALESLSLEGGYRNSIELPPAMNRLIHLDLQSNRLTNLALLNPLTDLRTLKLGFNGLTNLTIPNTLTELTSLGVEVNLLRSIEIPPTLTNLIHLSVLGNRMTNFAFLETASSLTSLNVSEMQGELNRAESLVLPETLTNLNSLVSDRNVFTNIILPPALRGLTNICIRANPITSFSFLANQTDLVVLDARDFPGTEFAAFPASLGSLRQLTASGSGLTNTSFLTVLTNLETLNLDRSEVFDLQLMSLGSLKSLSIRDCLVGELHIPSQLGGLSYLDTRGRRITNLSLATGLTNLKEIRALGNRLGSLPLPSDLVSLEHLDLIECSLTNLSLPPNLSQLRTIQLSQNSLSTLEVPEGYSNLQFLGAQANPLTNFIVSADATRLHTIDLIGNRLDEFALPDGLTGLREIRVNSAHVESIRLPADLVSLNVLDLRDCSLSDAGFLDGLERVNSLDLTGNRFSEFTLPGGIGGLFFLQVRDNGLEKFTIPNSATNLPSIYASGNLLQELTVPGEVKDETYIDVSENPINRVSIHFNSAITVAGIPTEQITYHAGPLLFENGQFYWNYGILQSAPTLKGPWTTVSSTSPFSPSANEPTFYRARFDQ